MGADVSTGLPRLDHNAFVAAYSVPNSTKTAIQCVCGKGVADETNPCPNCSRSFQQSVGLGSLELTRFRSPAIIRELETAVPKAFEEANEVELKARQRLSEADAMVEAAKLAEEEAITMQDELCRVADDAIASAEKAESVAKQLAAVIERGPRLECKRSLHAALDAAAKAEITALESETRAAELVGSEQAMRLRICIQEQQAKVDELMQKQKAAQDLADRLAKDLQAAREELWQLSADPLCNGTESAKKKEEVLQAGVEIASRDRETANRLAKDAVDLQRRARMEEEEFSRAQQLMLQAQQEFDMRKRCAAEAIRARDRGLAMNQVQVAKDRTTKARLAREAAMSALADATQQLSFAKGLQQMLASSRQEALARPLICLCGHPCAQDSNHCDLCGLPCGNEGIKAKESKGSGIRESSNTPRASPFLTVRDRIVPDVVPIESLKKTQAIDQALLTKNAQLSYEVRDAPPNQVSDLPRSKPSNEQMDCPCGRRPVRGALFCTCGRPCSTSYKIGYLSPRPVPRRVAPRSRSLEKP